MKRGEKRVGRKRKWGIRHACRQNGSSCKVVKVMEKTLLIETQGKLNVSMVKL